MAYPTVIDAPYGLTTDQLDRRSGICGLNPHDGNCKWLCHQHFLW
jgi:hypothetical protein